MRRFETIEQVKQSPYLKNLEAIANNYGVYGRFVEILNNPDIDMIGVYFLYGADKISVMSTDIDIRGMYNAGFRDRMFFHRDCIVQKITNKSDFAVHTNVLNNLRHCELINNLEKEHNLNLPGKITTNNLITLRNLYVQSHASGISQSEYASYASRIRGVLENELKYHDTTTQEYKDIQYHNAGYYDGSRGKLYNWYRKKFVTNKNRVSLAHLSNVSLDTTQRRVINIKYMDDVRKELDKHPEILYHMSDAFGQIESREFSMGDAVKNLDMRMFRLTYDREYEREINVILNRIFYPEATKRTVEDLMSITGQCITVGIAKDDYENFKQLCKDNNVEFCIDAQYTTEQANILNIVASTNEAEMLRRICYRMAQVSEDLHIYSPPKPPGVSTSEQEKLLKAVLKENPNFKPTQYISVEEIDNYPNRKIMQPNKTLLENSNVLDDDIIYITPDTPIESLFR